jgi:CheY-like chemotaxis protein
MTMAEPKHIVVMNDEPTILDALQELLIGEGYRVTVLRESRGAYERIKAIQPDLAILDMRMGNELVGFELIELLTLDPATSGIPLVVCSAASQALREHADQLAHQNIPVLAKPFRLDELLTIIGQVLSPDVAGEP